MMSTKNEMVHRSNKLVWTDKYIWSNRESICADEKVSSAHGKLNGEHEKLASEH